MTSDIEAERGEVRRLSAIRRGEMSAEDALCEVFGLNPDEVMSMDFSVRAGSKLTLNVALQPADEAAGRVVAVLRRYELRERIE